MAPRVLLLAPLTAPLMPPLQQVISSSRCARAKRAPTRPTTRPLRSSPTSTLRIVSHNQQAKLMPRLMAPLITPLLPLLRTHLKVRCSSQNVRAKRAPTRQRFQCSAP